MSIVSIIMIFIGINIDTFIALLFILHQCPVIKAMVGVALANVCLWLVGVVISKTVSYVFPNWIVGLMGFVLLGLALRPAGDSDVQKKTGVLTVFTLCLGLGGDNLAVFIPLAINLKLAQISLITVIFACCSAIMVALGKLTIRWKPIARLIEKYGAYGTKMVYIGAGIYIILNSHIIEHVIALS